MGRDRSSQRKIGKAAPRISCLVPMAGAAESLSTTVHSFLEQEYPDLELIVIEDETASHTKSLPQDSRIQVVQLPQGVPYDVRCDYAVQVSTGELLVFWGDDGWSRPRRLLEQSAPLRESAALAVVLESGLHYFPEERVWRQLEPADGHVPTLLFRRALWSSDAEPPQVRVDAEQVKAVSGEGLYFRIARKGERGQWRDVAAPAWAAEWQQRFGERLLKRDPLVSCIMPTAGRPELAANAVRQFLAQTYEKKELIVLDAGHVPVAPYLPADPRIRYLRGEPASSVGALRNAACAAARGEIIAHWDDDDWMAPWRLGYQVEQLLAAGADLCGLDRLYFFDPTGERAWLYEYPADEQEWVAGGTMCYRREVWERQPFPDLQVGEDNVFAWSGAAQRILRLADRGFYAATVHAGNTSPKTTENERWSPRAVTEVRSLLGDGWGVFRRLLTPAKKGRPRARTGGKPLVSCILATLDRPQFFRQAIRYYLRQTYTRTELIVIDDGKQSVEHLCQGLPDVRYIRCPEPTMLGTKLNLGIQQSRGEVIQKLDDDDYYAPQFLEEAVGALMETAPGAAVVAWCCFLVLLPGEPMPRYSGHGWAAGPTLCFDRALWERSPFRDIPRAVDEKFMEDAKVDIVRVCRPESLILVRHGRRHTWNSMSDQSSVDGFFGRQPEYPKPILDVVAPIDGAFYRPILGLQEKS